MKTETDKAYAAGVLDSDGSLGIYYANGATTKSQIVIAVQDMELLEWFKSLWGGRIEGNGRNQRVNKWVVGSVADREAFLADVLPYLRTKRDIAELVFEYILFRTKTNEEYCERTKALNSRLSREFQLLSTDKQGGE